MRSTARSSRSLLVTLLCGVVTLASAACAGSGGDLERAAADTGVAVLTGEQNPTLDPGFAVPAPGRLRGSVVTPDLVLVGRGTLSPRVRRRVSRVSGGSTAVPLSVASVPIRGRTVTLGAVDPAAFRRFAPAVPARTEAVWQRVAEGELTLTPEVADALAQPLGGDLVLGNAAGALSVRVGAVASLPPQLDGVVNHLRGSQLGMVRDNALLVAVGTGDPAAVAESLADAWAGVPRSPSSERGRPQPAAVPHFSPAAPWPTRWGPSATATSPTVLCSPILRGCRRTFAPRWYRSSAR